MKAIKTRIEGADLGHAASIHGRIEPRFDKSSYLAKLLGYVDLSELKPLKILGNPDNRAVGPVLQALTSRLPFEWVIINETQDGHFPNGVPNPLLPKNREQIRQALVQYGCDLGVAWDDDFDRCFFFDTDASFNEGYYLVGLLVELLLADHSGEKIFYDPLLCWNTLDEEQHAKGATIQSKTGHAFIKERMRVENAIYGGEMRALHYSRDIAHCDSGMVPWLIVTALMPRTGKTLARLVDMAAYPCNDEIKFKVARSFDVLKWLEKYYATNGPKTDLTDGLSMEFIGWRIKLRASNAEPLLRLNIETNANQLLLEKRITEICMLIKPVN